MKKVTLSLLVFIVLAGITHYYYQSMPSNEVIVGVIAPLSGPFAPYGEEIRKGVSAAIIPGIKVIYEDESCDPKTAISAFKKLTELDKATVIIGPACGAPQKAIAPLLQNSAAVAITPTAAPEELFLLSNKRMFDIQYSLEDESTFMAEKLYDLGYKRVAVIGYKNAFSEAHTRTFTSNYKGTIVTSLSLDDMSSTIDVNLLKLSKQNFDAIFITDISFFFAGGANKLKANKITAPLFATYEVELPMARSLVNGVIYSFPKDIPGSDGGTYALSKNTAETIFPIALKCKGDASCIKEKLIETTEFNEHGVKKRELTLKRITGDNAELYESK